jgi:glutathione synthase/RimK-type ligase-like ATP-grasp enzyme
LLKVDFRYQGKWHIDTVKPIHLTSASSEPNRQLFIDALNSYAKPWRTPRAKSTSRYDLAILHNPAEIMPPSNSAALQKFVRAGKKQGVDVELIEKKDYGRRAEYDALFIRETTNIDHYTYRVARNAQIEGIVVIDAPGSILKCANKVFLAELMDTHRIPAPKSKVLLKGHAESIKGSIGLPLVLKIPDGSFSRGVFKADTERAFKSITEKLFKESDLILAQEFAYTQFDWRIGILNGQALFACQYFMSRAHWQVVRHRADRKAVEGNFRTLPVEEAPSAVVNTALGIAKLIGDGLKQIKNGVYVIEINDNPNIDAGIEDRVLGDKLYQIIIAEFVRRLDAGLSR